MTTETEDEHPLIWPREKKEQKFKELTSDENWEKDKEQFLLFLADSHGLVELSRKLTDDELRLIWRCYHAKDIHLSFRCFATTTADVYDSEKTHKIKAGSTVRITMVSRFGDVGISPKLKEEHGYLTRMAPASILLSNIREEP